MPADLILQGATVHTVDAARRTAAAVAIENGRIAAVGDAREMGALRGPTTRVVDLDGAMILPGFQDAHCHLGEAGHARTLCSLEDSRDADEHLRRIAAYGDAHPERDWIVGSGWSMSDFPGGTPTAAALTNRLRRLIACVSVIGVETPASSEEGQRLPYGSRRA
jgi:predicted amidohydrolase YtcJ